MTGDVNDVMPGSDGLTFLVFLNKIYELIFGLRRSELGFESGRGQSTCLLRGAQARLLGQMKQSA